MSMAWLRAVIVEIEAACPVCGGEGWTTESDPSDGATPMRVPCRDAEHSVILNAGLADPRRALAYRQGEPAMSRPTALSETTQTAKMGDTTNE